MFRNFLIKLINFERKSNWTQALDRMGVSLWERKRIADDAVKSLEEEQGRIRKQVEGGSAGDSANDKIETKQAA